MAKRMACIIIFTLLFLASCSQLNPKLIGRWQLEKKSYSELDKTMQTNLDTLNLSLGFRRMEILTSNEVLQLNKDLTFTRSLYFQGEPKTEAAIIISGTFKQKGTNLILNNDSIETSPHYQFELIKENENVVFKSKSEKAQPLTLISLFGNTLNYLFSLQSILSIATTDESVLLFHIVNSGADGGTTSLSAIENRINKAIGILHGSDKLTYNKIIETPENNEEVIK